MINVMKKEASMIIRTPLYCFRGKVSPKRSLQKHNASCGYIALIGFICCFCLAVTSQAQRPTLPPLAATPEAYSFKQGVFRTVSYYTGQANVSIPLYNIETRDITFPVELTYIGGEGLRLLSTYSSAGFGWKVSAGGAITRTVNGEPDEYRTSTSDHMHGFFSLFDPGVTVPSNDSVRNHANTFLSSGQGGGFSSTHEYSPDIFTFSFLGYSGYFVMGYDGEFRVVSENITRVEKKPGPSNSTLYKYNPISFILTASDGTKFSFGSETGSVEITGGDETAAIALAWYMTKIEFSNGNVINLNYHPNIDDKLRIKTYYDTEIYIIRPVVIDNISFDNGSIVFTSTRKPHAMRLGDDNLRLINAIDVKDYNDRNVSHIDLNHRTQGSGRFYMLGSLSIDNKLYSFDYYGESSLPSIHASNAFGSDYWGYNNGYPEIDPGSTYNSMNFTKDMFFNENGAFPFRVPSELNTKTGVLTSITHPSGVTEYFEYELHTYLKRYVNGLDGPRIGSLPSPENAGGLRIKKITTADMVRTFEYGSYGILYKKPAVSYLLSMALNELSIEGEPHMTYSKVTERRSDGSYTEYEMNSLADRIYGHEDVDYYELNPGYYAGWVSDEAIYTHHSMLAFINAFGKHSSRALERGQVSKISNYDSSAKLVKSTSYTYSRDPDRYSHYVASIELISSVEKNLSQFVLDLLKEYSVPSAFSFLHSYCIYTFPVHLEKESTSYYRANDTITQTIRYQYNDQKLLSSTTTYNSSGDSLITRFKYPLDYDSFSTAGYSDKAIIATMQEKSMINKVIEEQSLVVKNGTSSPMLTGGRIHRYKKQDGVNGLNGVIVPWEEYELKLPGPDPNTTSSYFSSDSYMHFHDKYNRTLSYDAYDAKGNITQYRNENNNPVSWLWAYNGNLPVVKAENISLSVLETAVKAAAGTTDLDAFWDGFNNIATSTTQQDSWKTFVTNLKNNSGLANTALMLYTYKPLVGITSRTDPGGITTYYEYDQFGRLQRIRDNNRNIIKHYEYHYKNEKP